MKKIIQIVMLVMASTMICSQAAAKEVLDLTLEDGTDLEVRVFPAEGDALLLGFACDEGQGLNEQATADKLSADGIEIWMPDMLGAYMLPKVKSSIKEIPTESLVSLIDKARQTGKKVYLIAGGPDSELVLRSISEWEKLHSGEAGKGQLDGAILMFPRLIDGKPVPGEEPKYVEAVGKTKLPLMVLEGERTPNRWGINHLTTALKAGGSDVVSKLIPSVRGYFFKRDDANVPEDLVTSQLSGLIKASLFYLDGANREIN